MLRQRARNLLTAVALPVGIALAVQGKAEARQVENPAGPAEVSYANDVVPILKQHCISCHGGTDESGEVRIELSFNMTTYEGLMAGSEYGSVIEPGNPDESILLDLVVDGDMPDEGELVPPEQIEVLRAWIAEGAKNN